jgi:hypothetical protein
MIRSDVAVAFRHGPRSNNGMGGTLHALLSKPRRFRNLPVDHHTDSEKSASGLDPSEPPMRETLSASRQ